MASCRLRKGAVENHLTSIPNVMAWRGAGGPLERMSRH